MDDFETEDDRKFVTALARGLDILRCFRPYETNLTNQEIAQRTGLPKPTISRLTHTLRKLDYLVYSERTGTYRLGAGVLALGFGVLSSIEMADRARDEMAALCEGPLAHITSAMAEPHRLRAVYTAVQRSKEAVALTISVGARLPLFHSAIGRAIIVGMPEKQRATLIDQGLAQAPEERSQILASVEKGLRDYEEYGLCTGFGEWRSHVNGLAVPVFSLNGDRVHGLNVGGPSFFAEPDDLMTHYAERLKRAAQNLSRGAPGRPGA